MWGTSSPEDKLAGDLGNVIEATSIGGRRSDFFTAKKLAPDNLRLLQQYRHKADVPTRSPICLLSGLSRHQPVMARMGENLAASSRLVIVIKVLISDEP